MADPKDKKQGEVIVVTARAARRRAGYAFGREPVTIALKDLSREQLEAISSDPALKIVRRAEAAGA